MRQLTSGRHWWPLCTTSIERPLLEPRLLWLWQRLQMKICWLHCWKFCIQIQWTIWGCIWHLTLKEWWKMNNLIDRGNSTRNFIYLFLYSRLTYCLSCITVFMLICLVLFEFNVMVGLQFFKETFITKYTFAYICF